MTAMTEAERDSFLQEPRIAKLATLNADGSPNIVPVWFDWDGEVARVFTTRGSAKMRRIAADPRAALSVETGVGENEAWVSIEGVLRVSEEDPIAIIKKLAPLYYSPEKAEASLRSWTSGEIDWVLLQLVPKRIRSMAPEA
jgi:PPOX class probable F420-dependent enzyme